MKKKIIFWRTLILVFVLFSNNSYANNGFQQPTNFYITAKQAQIKNIPILVMFSSIYCDYCKFIKKEFLKPMLKSGDYSDKVIIKIVEDDESDEVIDFNRRIIDSGDFSDRYGITFTPTIIFINSKGQEVAERITGLGNVEYYGGFLDDAIDQALIKLNKYVQNVE